MPLDYTANLRTLDKLKNDLAFQVRKRAFDLFMRELQPGPRARCADFGVSGHRDHPVHYFFESLYPWKDKLTAIGQAAEDARWFPEQFPGLQFIEADLRSIPVEDNYFDVGICNAVVEHGGPTDQQKALVREVCRVSKSVMFTTPNRAFPFELHTFVPFAHWLPHDRFYDVLRMLGHDGLASIDQLHPLNPREFVRLFPRERHNRLMPVGLPLLQTNLVVISSAR